MKNRVLSTNRWTRSLTCRVCIDIRGRRGVYLNDEERQDFADMVRIGRKLQRLDDATPAEWVRGRTIDRDVTRMVIALARGWRWSDNGYPVPGDDR